MDFNLLKSFIKYSYITWGIGLTIGILLALVHFQDFGYFALFFVLGIFRDAYHYKARIEKIARLKTKGLTEADIGNIAFVKKWEETRNAGLWNYCIKDGGIITGALLSIFISLLYFIITHKSIAEQFSEPGNMFSFIGYSYIAGAILGAVSYRIAWTINERRFLRLTDPLNTIFTDKNKSYSDLI